MNYIKSLYIEGFKKFVRLDVPFNEHMNILVGENEVGKSTILDAIKVVLNQQYRNADKSILKDLFNTQKVEQFIGNPTVQTLPYIYIELQMELDPKGKNAEYFYGENNLLKAERFGIVFECRFDEELGNGLETDIIAGKIPYEYYTLRWTTFSGMPYYMVKRPFNFLAIDTSNSDATNSFNYYNRTLFTSRYDESTRLGVKNAFRDGLNVAFSGIGLEDIDEHRKFGINEKKVVLETILSVYENSIALENRGSGMESLIKTQIALDKRKSKLDVILMEEPENHLCFASMRKMLQEISDRQSDSQILVATHSNMIASRLNLNNVLWITNGTVISLKGVDEKVAAFFVKADNNSFLQLLLSEKVFLVEGATEFLLLPKIYFQFTQRTIEDDCISIISCNGISYKHYLEIAKETGKRIAVITDNDKKKKRIDETEEFNFHNDNQHIFMGSDVGDWTWESCFYNLNQAVLDNVIEVQVGAEYLVHGNSYGQVLGKMLNNKVDVAYQMLVSDIAFEIPQYVKDAITWLNE